MEAFKSLADIKRSIRPGMAVRVENFLYPEVSGARTIHKAQTNAIATEMADGRIGWVDYPKSARARIEGRSLTFLTEDGEPAFTYHFEEA